MTSRNTVSMLLGSVADPDSFYPDPDSEFQVNPDPEFDD